MGDQDKPEGKRPMQLDFDDLPSASTPEIPAEDGAAPLLRPAESSREAISTRDLEVLSVVGNKKSPPKPPPRGTTLTGAGPSGDADLLAQPKVPSVPPPGIPAPPGRKGTLRGADGRPVAPLKHREPQVSTPAEPTSHDLDTMAAINPRVQRDSDPVFRAPTSKHPSAPPPRVGSVPPRPMDDEVHGSLGLDATDEPSGLVAPLAPPDVSAKVVLPPPAAKPLTSSAPPKPPQAKSSSTPLFIGLAVVASVAVGYFLMAGEDDAPTPSVPTAEPTPALAEEKPAELPSTTVPDLSAPSSASAAAKVNDASSGESSRATERADAPRGNQTQPATAATAESPKAGATAVADATPSPPEPKPTAEEQPPASGAAFDAEAARAALATAGASAQACKQPDDPVGSAKVTVTFTNSGRVTRALVTGPPFAGTPTGSCIAGAFKRASVPPFGGDPVAVSRTVQIR